MTDNTPTIRFSGFTGSWEQRKLENITSLITKGTTPKDKSGEGEVNFIKVENIDSSSGEITSYSRISLEEHDGYLKRSQLKENDILFSIAGTLGRTSVVNKSILPANTNQALAILRMSEGDISYLVTVLRGRAVSDFIKKNPTVGAQPNLSLEQVSNLEIPYPKSEEQHQIGTFFTRLDHIITLHQRKCDALQKFKKSMLQKMFPRDGENVPEIRFAGFTDAWEQRKVGECCEFINGDRSSNYPSATDFVENGIPFVGSDALGSTLIDKTKLRFISIEKYEQMNGLKIEINDILYTLRGAGFGKCAIADFTDGTVASSLVGIRCNDSLRAKFLIQYLNSSNADNEKNKAVNGSTAQNISVEDMKKYSISVPNLAEQERISDYLCSLDTLITLHQRKLETLQKMKKSLLQKMFPPAGRAGV